MSLFPLWCDEYEIHNPIISQVNNIAVTTRNDPHTEQIERNDQGDRLNNQGQDGENISNNPSYISNPIPREIEMKNTLEKPLNEASEQLSEKLLIKSSNDTRLVNQSEGHFNKYFLVDENKTENEFVFSENVNIDTLSHNEVIIESLKKKYEKEHEDGSSENK